MLKERLVQAWIVCPYCGREHLLVRRQSDFTYKCGGKTRAMVLGDKVLWKEVTREERDA
jgi:hypothetical protein